VVSYGGKQSRAARYSCCAGRIRRGEQDCIAFGGIRVDQAVSQAVFKVVEPFAIEASLKAAEEINAGIEEQHELVELELESAQYEAQRAYRQYNKVDPENRLVCMELEKKWNNCLDRVAKIKEKLSSLKKPSAPLREKEKQDLFELSSNLKRLWELPSTTNELRKRLIRTVIKEIICDVDEQNHLILLIIHWEGGIHTELQVKRKRTGEHTRCTDKSIVELVRQLAKQLPDKSIAPVLNRLQLKTGAGNNWTRDRIRTLRSYHRIASYRNREADMLTLRAAAEKLGVCDQSVRSFIKQGIINAEQVVSFAPWAIPVKELEKEEVKTAVQRIKSGSNRRNSCSRIEGQLELF
jgi:hypothetical protein